MSWEDSIEDAEYVPAIVHPQMEDIVRRAIAAGAKPPLEYVGAGMTAVVLCAGKTAYKIARTKGDDRFLSKEAEWLTTAKTVPWVKDHVAKIRRFDRENTVIIRECPMPDPEGGARGMTPYRYGEGKLFDLHQEIGKRMIPYGWTAPEFKPDSYVITEHGPVLVNASMPSRVGQRLLDYVRDVLEGRRNSSERLSDLAFAIRLEVGRTITQEEANEVFAQLPGEGAHEMREDPPKRTWQQIEADVRRRNKKIAEFVAANDGRSFSAPTFPNHWPIDYHRKRPIPEFIVVHPDPHHEGGWRFSRFEGTARRAEAVGHGERAKYADAVRDAVRDYGLDLDKVTFERDARQRGLVEQPLKMHDGPSFSSADRKKIAADIARRQREQARAEIAAARQEAANARAACTAARQAAASACSAAKDLRSKRDALVALAREYRLIRRAELARLGRQQVPRGPRQESDEEVRNNIPPELVPTWEVEKRGIKGNPRKSRTEAFLEWVEQHPTEIVYVEPSDEDYERSFANRRASEMRLRRRP